jgi:hypothetical protein
MTTATVTTTTTPGNTIAGIAGTAETVIEDVMKIEPVIAGGAMFIPGAAPILALVQPAVLMAAPYVEQALKALSAGNGGDAFDAFIALLQHLTPGKPNAPALSPAGPITQ